MATAQQAWAQTDLALKQQQEALEKAYKKQLEETQKAYELAGSQSERNMLAKGMQRSSYGAATLGNINIKGAEAKADIMESRTDALGNIAERRTLLRRQLAEQLAATRSAAGLNRSSSGNPPPETVPGGFSSMAEYNQAFALGFTTKAAWDAHLALTAKPTPITTIERPWRPGTGNVM